MKPGFVGHLALSLLGASASRALWFALVPVAARLYGKDDFGGLALAIGFIGLVQPFLTLRYEISVVLVRSERAARALLWGAIGIAALGYICLCLAVVGAPALLSSFLDVKLLASLRTPVLVHLAAGVLNVLLVAWLQRRRMFSGIAASQFAGALVAAILVLGAPLVVEPRLHVLVWGYAAGAVSTGLVLAAWGRNTKIFVCRPPLRLRRILLLLAKYRVYPTYTLPLTISSLISDRLLLLYLFTAFSIGTLGGFFSVRQLLFGMVHLVTSSINQVVFPYVCHMANGVMSARRPLLAITRGLAVSAGLPLGWLCIYPAELTVLFFGDQWLDVAEMVRWIAAHAAVLTIVGWQGRLLDIEQRQRADAALQIAGDFALVAGLCVLWSSSASVIVVVAVVSVIGIAHAVGSLIVIYRVIGLGARHAIASELLLLGSAFAAAALAAICKAGFGTIIGMTMSLVMIGSAMVLTILVTAKAINDETGAPSIPTNAAWRRGLDAG
jgi:O-antigen/teichoic acid export membrane protein